jgi:hypothetical protein
MVRAYAVIASGFIDHLVNSVWKLIKRTNSERRGREKNRIKLILRSGLQEVCLVGLGWVGLVTNSFTQFYLCTITR